MAVEILIEPIDIAAHGFIRIDLALYQTRQKRLFHRVVFMLKTVLHQDGKDGIVPFIGFHGIVEGLEGTADGIRLIPVLPDKAVGQVSGDVLLRLRHVGAKDILDMPGQSATVPYGD